MLYFISFLWMNRKEVGDLFFFYFWLYLFHLSTTLYLKIIKKLSSIFKTELGKCFESDAQIKQNKLKFLTALSLSYC